MLIAPLIVPPAKGSLVLSVVLSVPQLKFPDPSVFKNWPELPSPSGRVQVISALTEAGRSIYMTIKNVHKNTYFFKFFIF